ncbi:hypothetical protein SH449x_004513 [Pirellulaceae bacterium SH449]
MSYAQPTHKSHGSAPLPQPIRQTLDQLRSLLGRYILLQAGVLSALWAVTLFWLCGWIDYLPAWIGASESPRWVRVCMLAILSAGIIYLFYQNIIKRWAVRWSDHALALLIERKYPTFQSSLITTVQSVQPSVTSNSVADHPTRPGLLALSRENALRGIETVNVEELVLKRPLQLQLVLLGFTLAVSVVLLLLNPEWTYLWSKRFFGLANDPWPRNVSLGIEGIEFEVPSFTGAENRSRYLLSFENGTLTYPRGQSGQLKSFASLDAKKVPESCTVYYYDADGNRGRANMRRLNATDRKQNFLLDGPPLESLNQSLTMSILGGDARLSDLKLKVVDPPLVTGLNLDVTYPEYLQRSTQSRTGTERMEYRTGLRIPLGSSVQLSVQANKEIRRCDFVIIDSTNRDQKVAIEQTVELEAPSKTFTIPVGTLQGNLLVEMRLWDDQGVCSNRVQQYVISTIVDNPPQVDMVLDGIGSAITELALLPIVGKVRDEYDVNEIWLELANGEEPLRRTDIDIRGTEEIRTQIDCKELRDAGTMVLQPKSTLALSLAASDYYDLSPEPHVGRSGLIQLSIVTPDELLLLLDRREAAMRKRLETIIGEMSQLRDLLLILERKPTPPPPSDDDSADPPPEVNQEEETARFNRLRLLRSQQALSQVSKSEGELNGVEREILQIAKELINNRVESTDRRTRWQEKIQQPLRSMLDTKWGVFAKGVSELEKLLAKTPDDQAPISELTRSSVERSNEIIVDLNAILSDMLEIQDQTAIIDMLRDIIDNNSSLIEETKGLKKERERKELLDILK